jgi:hypothetical protein
MSHGCFSWRTRTEKVERNRVKPDEIPRRALITLSILSTWPDLGGFDAVEGRRYGFSFNLPER